MVDSRLRTDGSLKKAIARFRGIAVRKRITARLIDYRYSDLRDMVDKFRFEAHHFDWLRRFCCEYYLNLGLNKPDSIHRTKEHIEQCNDAYECAKRDWFLRRNVPGAKTKASYLRQLSLPGASVHRPWPYSSQGCRRLSTGRENGREGERFLKPEIQNDRTPEPPSQWKAKGDSK